MKKPPYCPNPDCALHTPQAVNGLRRRKQPTFQKCGTRKTQTFGIVQRYRCTACGITFSTQTFSIDYYAKRAVDYKKLEKLSSGSAGLRESGRILGCSPGTVSNRLGRLNRRQQVAGAGAGAGAG